jgi:rubrerythrin
MPEGFTRLGDDLTIPAGHPLAGREAWQCNICQGIFYQEDNEPVECPYCTDEDEAA